MGWAGSGRWWCAGPHRRRRVVRVRGRRWCAASAAAVPTGRCVAIACWRTRGSGCVIAVCSAGMITSPSATRARLRLNCVSRSPRPSWVARTRASPASSPSGTSTTATRQALRATSCSASLSSARVIAGHARRSPILDSVCRAWLRACARAERSSSMSLGTVADAAWRVRAHVNMSRTKKSGSIAHRSMSRSTNRGSGAVPTASAACSRTDELLLSRPWRTCMAFVSGFGMVIEDSSMAAVNGLSPCQGQASIDDTASSDGIRTSRVRDRGQHFCLSVGGSAR